jgi:hypothetical protein
VGVYLKPLLDQMTDRLGDSPAEANSEAVQQAAFEIANSVSKEDAELIWSESGTALLVRYWSGDPYGHLYNVWSMELRHEGGHAGSTNGE